MATIKPEQDSPDFREREKEKKRKREERSPEQFKSLQQMNNKDSLA